MIGVYVTVPAACFRKGLAREYLESEQIPPPSTCYGFLLSLVGESDRQRHIGVRVAPMLLNEPDLSVVLRTVWRVKKAPLGSSGNTRPDFQQLLTQVELIIWLSSDDELHEKPFLEERVKHALNPSQRFNIQRFGGLSLGESTHLVNDVSFLDDQLVSRLQPKRIRQYVLRDRGLIGLPVWVDHVGAAGTSHVVGDLITIDSIIPPLKTEIPKIGPKTND